MWRKFNKFTDTFGWAILVSFLCLVSLAITRDYLRLDPANEPIELRMWFTFRTISSMAFALCALKWYFRR